MSAVRALYLGHFPRVTINITGDKKNKIRRVFSVHLIYKKKKPITFFSLYLQNLKNQIMTTNLWVEQVMLFFLYFRFSSNQVQSLEIT